MMGLRSRLGCSHQLLSSWLKQIYESTPPKIKRLQDLGFLEIEQERIRATRKGFAVLNCILPDIVETLDQEG